MKETTKKIKFDENLRSELFDLINKWNFWYEDSNYIDMCSFLCASAERLESSCIFFNKQEELDCDDKVILFMNHASIVCEVINQCSKRCNFKLEETNFFQDVYDNSFLYKEEYPKVTDDEFFMYLRSLFFAHPNETSRPKFLKANNEFHYSPWPIPELDVINSLTNEHDFIGIRIYSSLSPEILNLRFSKSIVINYCKSKCDQFKKVIDYVKEINRRFEEEIKTRKLEFTGNLLFDLNAIKKELALRYASLYEINELIDYCGINFDNKQNNKSLNIFKNDLKNRIPIIIEKLNNLDHDSFLEEISKFSSSGYKIYYENENYHLEKIFCYLRDDQGYESIRWGLTQLKHFKEHYAKDYVCIDEDNMSFAEIKALVTIARYLRSKEDKNDTI